MRHHQATGVAQPSAPTQRQHSLRSPTTQYAKPGAPQPSSGLGFQPRDYFEDETASARFDLDGEASAFTAWANQTLGVAVSSDEIRSLLADDDEEEPNDDFAEETVARLLSLLHVPLPDGIPTFPD
jgi:hypothetical protein